jgi:hypothetical protein
MGRNGLGSGGMFLTVSWADSEDSEDERSRVNWDSALYAPAVSDDIGLKRDAIRSLDAFNGMASL